VEWSGHLEPVTSLTNLLRSRSLLAVNATKTMCKHGHPFDEANTVHAGGRRTCRACRTAIHARVNERKRAATAAARREERTHCVNEHPWNSENVYVAPSGLKTCRVCTAEAQTRYLERKAAAKRP
jgi:hypothetical protein